MACRIEHELREILRAAVLAKLLCDLDPKLVDKMLTCFYDYRFPPEMQKAFDGADRFFPINYKTNWEVVRAVAKGSGGGFDKAAYDKETAREAAEAAAKKK